MLKIRLHGLPEEVLQAADKLAEGFEILNKLSISPDRGESKFVRMYVDAEQKDLSVPDSRIEQLRINFDKK